MNSASGRTLPDLPRSHKRAFATISTVITPVIITCSSFHLFTECRIILRPLTVHLRFELWLPIFGNSAQYFAVLHFPFSSHGSSPYGGILTRGHQCYCSRSNILFKCPVILLSFLCFEARVNYRRLKAGGIPLHRCPIEQTYKGSSAHVFVLIASIYFGEVNLRYLHCFMTQCKGSIQPLPEGQRYNLPLDPNAIN